MGKVKNYFFDEIERDSYKWDEYEHYRDSTYGDTEDIYDDYFKEYKQFRKNMISTPISEYPYDEGLEEAVSSLSSLSFGHEE